MSTQQLRSVIQWEDPDSYYLVEKWSEDGDEIKNASKLIVGPGQGCIFTVAGKIEGVFEQEGLFELKTGNTPFWTTVTRFMNGFESERKVGIWFFHRTQQTQQKFGTPSPVKYQDPVYGFPVGLRVFGNFSFRIADIALFFREIAGLGDYFEIDEARGLIASKLIHPLTEVLANSGYSYAEIDSHRSDIANKVLDTLKPAIQGLGLVVTDLKLDGTSFDDDTMGRINRITDLQAEAVGARAVGLDFAGLKEAEAPRAPREAPKPPEDTAAALKKIKALLEEELISQEEYDAKRKEILAKL